MSNLIASYRNQDHEIGVKSDWLESVCKWSGFRTSFFINGSVKSTIPPSRSSNSRTWDKKIPSKEVFLLFLSGTARACLVPRVAVWYRLSGTPFCSFTSVTMTSQRKAQSFPRHQRVSVTLKRTLSACFSLKCTSHWGTRKIIKSQCWIQTDKYRSRVIRCHIPVSATASTGICDIVSPSTEICQSGSNTGTWFY